ncbi:MAG: ammonium transporter [Coriobacteriia bacterium]|nr:ammonium transporter [Coriobacteriia bacterium]MBN2822160.1 ammonium transporter [Coriobacteriia bacterium]
MRKGKLALFGSLIAVLMLALPAVALAADPSGVATLEADAGAPIDFIWMLVAAFLVYFMQAGFAMVEAGFCRAKNTTNLMMKNMMDFVMGSLAYFIVGFALMYGADKGGLIGTTGFLMGGDNYDVTVYRDFMFQVVFAATAATIVSGAVAERLKFNVYLIYSVVLSAVIYPIYGHWVWGGGWLSALGHLDFAGSGVVHAVGGFVGLAGAIVLGPRFGKYDKDGKPRAIPGHSIALAALGAFILWFGWFGFNPGSTLSGHDLRIAVIAVNTNMAAAAGAAVALLITYFKTKVWDVGMGINGALAGLVAITAPCAWVSGGASILIGMIAGVLVVVSVLLVENMGVDDPVGAFSVHGVNGIFGLIAVGLWADGTYNGVAGLFYGGGTELLVAQLTGAVTVMAWAFGLGFVLFKTLDLIMGIRVSPEEELSGLDMVEHGGSAYPNFILVEE